LTQRYVKRHGDDRKSAEFRHLCGFSSPHLTLRFQDDFWGWNADRIPKLFIGEVVGEHQDLWGGGNPASLTGDPAEATQAAVARTPQRS
jgi:hypothetical protein